jgi:hypothetical protein
MPLHIVRAIEGVALLVTYLAVRVGSFEKILSVERWRATRGGEEQYERRKPRDH